MDTYIIRIYQREDDKMIGVIESTESEGNETVFHSAGELWGILASGPAGISRNTEMK